MASQLLITPSRATDSGGAPYSGAVWYFYNTGTLTPLSVYADAALVTSLGVSVTSDSSGKFPPVYFDSSKVYRAVLKNSSGSTTLYDIDPINTDVFSSLIASGGAALIGFSAGLAGSVTRTVQGALRDDFVSPEDFGCVAVEDGGTAVDNTANFLKTLNSGRPVDGGSKTYLLGSQLTPTSFKGLQNCNFAWKDAPAMAQQAALLQIKDLSDWFIDNCVFDMGNQTNTGSANDSSRFGLQVYSSSPNVLFNERFYITRCTFKGYGNGTRLFVRSCKRGIVANNRVSSSQVAFTPDPSNDCQNGIDVSQCSNMVVTGNSVYDLRTWISGTLVKAFSRGMLFFELRDSTVAANSVSGCDQNFDFSGAVDGVTDISGNVGLSVTGNTSANCRTWGFKFANCMRDSTIAGNVSRGFGFGGFVFSGATVAPPSGFESTITSRLVVSGNHACDPNGDYGRTDCIGFWIGEQAASVGYPRGIKLVGNTVSDSTGGGRLLYGFRNDVTYDGSSGLLNELINCRSIGHTGTASLGFSPWRTSVTSSTSTSITNTTATDVPWDSEVIDGPNGHDNASNTPNIYARSSGTYRVTFTVVFSSNSAGYRKIRVLKNGGALPGGDFTRPAVNGDVTTVEGSLLVSMAAGDHIRLEAYQNSGGALNINRVNSLFTVELLEIA